MKFFYAIFLLVFITAGTYAQSPQRISYQAVIRNSSNVLVTSSPVGMRISILQGSSTGTPVYIETQTPTTNLNGLVTLEIGGGTPVTGTFTSIDWSLVPYFIKTETDPNGGTSYTITGTSQILSVPYASFSLGLQYFSVAGLDNLIIGKQAGLNNSGVGNTLLGSRAGGSVNTGSNNTFIGRTSGNSNTSGFQNTFVGTDAGLGNTAGASNVYIGKVSGCWNFTGNFNIAIGVGAGYYNNGSSNVILGYNAGWGASVGTTNFNNNSFFGHQSGNKTTTGSGNVYIGYQSGYNNLVGNNNVLLGYQAGVDETGSNKLYISNSSTTTPLIYGEFNNSALTINGSLKATAGINANNKTITNVSDPVNSTDAANKTYVDKMLSIIQTIQTGVRDIDGNKYKVILIGNQLWMTESLKTTKYNDGTAIANITDNTAWAALTIGGYSDYDNTPANSTTYGRLYNWYAVDNNAATKVASNGGKNVCPTGWHVPTDAEWTTLTDYLTNNGYGYEGSGNDIAKSIGASSGWNTSGILGTVGNDQASNNSSGFTALPSGNRTSDGTYLGIGYYGAWWSSSGWSTSNAITWGMDFQSSIFIKSVSPDRKEGYAVRCLKD
jgi:uncharacterized protein (TIGR02145 family)